MDKKERIRRFEGHSAQIYSVAFSPDGKLAISGSSDTTAIIWDVSTGTEINRLTGDTDAVLSVAFSPDGKTVLTGSADKSVRQWIVMAALSELMDWTKANRFVRGLTCAERDQYKLPPLCPTPTPGFGTGDGSI
jgi:WD40 repeat protein